MDKPGGIFVLSSATASDDDIATISAAARVVLLSNAGSLAAQLDRQNGLHRFRQSWRCRKRASRPKSPASSQVNDLLFWNGFGGFSPDGREYTITVEVWIRRDGLSYLRHPGATSLANENFGCLTTEAGFGYSWSGNSQIEQADALVERSGFRCARRSSVLKRRGNRRDLDADALAAWKADDRFRSSRPRLHAATKPRADNCIRY